MIRRRAALAAPALLAGCASPLPPRAYGEATPEALALLDAAAAAHGAAVLAAIRDLSVAYAGEWPALIGRIQPALVDQGFRAASEERFLLADGLLAQAHTGPRGRKHVVRPRDVGAVAVSFNGTASTDAEARAAAALVADGYSLFLLGPMLLTGRWRRDRQQALALAPPETITVFGTRHACDVLRLRVAPGLGFAAADEFALWIDRATRRMHRVRFSLDGLEATRGAIAEVDCADHIPLGGMVWPTRYRERLLRPFPLRVHDWRLTGLDLDRGMATRDVAGDNLTGPALAPARPLPVLSS